MKKNMRKIIGCALMAFICLQCIYKTEASEVALTRGGTYTTLIETVSEPVSPAKPYTSPSFVPESERISFILVADGKVATKYTFTYYIQIKNNNGTWSNVYTNTIRGGSGISTSYNVISGERYRVYVTTNDDKSKDDYVRLTIYEYR